MNVLGRARFSATLPSTDLVQESPMIAALSGALTSQAGSRSETDRRRAEPSVDFELHRSRSSLRRHRVLSSAAKVAALFHNDSEDGQSLH
jgi:hypothetical protein